MAIHPKTQARLDWLADRDIVTSICYGKASGLGVIWTVNCMTSDAREFARPVQAHTFEHAVEIAVLHSIKLGFVEGPEP